MILGLWVYVTVLFYIYRTLFEYSSESLWSQLIINTHLIPEVFDVTF
jgi:hypothetical protein